MVCFTLASNFINIKPIAKLNLLAIAMFLQFTVVNSQCVKFHLPHLSIAIQLSVAIKLEDSILQYAYVFAWDHPTATFMGWSHNYEYWYSYIFD